MEKFSNALEIFQILPQTNCKACGLSTCMAFAGHVHLKKKRLTDCPHLATNQYEKDPTSHHGTDDDHLAQTIADLRQQITTLHLHKYASHLGGHYTKGRLTLSVFGKPLALDQQGTIFTDLHILPGLIIPVYTYVLMAKNNTTHPYVSLQDDPWVRLRELPLGSVQEHLFIRRCEIPLCHLAESNFLLFKDLLHMFQPQEIREHLHADISLILKPLPHLPILLCYWKADEGMDASLHLFFKSSASIYLDVVSIHTLISRFTTMLERLFMRHSKG